MPWFNNLYPLFGGIQPFLPVIFLISFGLVSPALAEDGNNSAAGNSTTAQVESLTTVEGICGSSILPIFNKDSLLIGYVGAFSNPMDTTAHVVYINPQGEHIDSTQVRYVENGEPPAIGPAVINLKEGPRVVFCSDQRIIIEGPNGQDVVTDTLAIPGNFSHAPVLRVNDNQLEISVPADSYNVDSTLYYAYIHKFIFNSDDSSVIPALGNWPVEFANAALGVGGLGQSDTIIISPITFLGGVPLDSRVYSIGSRGDTLWSNSIGLSMTRGPALYSRGDSLQKITVGAVDVIDGQTYGCVYIFDAEGEPLRLPFCELGHVLFGPIYTDLNGDDYPDILFTLGGTPSRHIF